jgi:protein-S-isoprenylcysteine O-methyltransferase Ste14
MKDQNQGPTRQSSGRLTAAADLAVICLIRRIMEKSLRDSAAIRVPPPVFFFACLGFGILLEYFFPIHLISLSPIPRVIVGGILMLASGYFAVSAFFVLIKNMTPFDTAKSTTKIVKEGAYRFSRNPLYLSLLLLLFGIAILLSSLWLFCTIPILYTLFLFKAVKPEESYLSQKFGEEYLTYSAKVRRWI